MASAKQIAANRANAQRSTGPKTALGKMKSSRNSFRHGLSWPLPPDLATASKVEALARALTPRDAGDAAWTSAMEFATAQIELVRIRTIRTELLRVVDISHLDTQKLQQACIARPLRTLRPHQTAASVAEVWRWTSQRS